MVISSKKNMRYIPNTSDKIKSSLLNTEKLEVSHPMLKILRLGYGKGLKKLLKFFTFLKIWEQLYLGPFSNK